MTVRTTPEVYDALVHGIVVRWPMLREGEQAPTCQQRKGIEMGDFDCGCKQLHAAQLHIKELREALNALTGMASYFPTELFSGHPDVLKALAVLAKQPDTRALDKALLEAELRGLNRNEERKETRCKLRRQF